MKKKVILIFFATISIHIILHFGYKYITKKNSILIQKDIRFFNNLSNKDSLSYLFMGDSHCDAIDTSLFKNSLVFNANGETYIQTYHKLNHLLTHYNTTIDTIILPLDIHSFSTRNEIVYNDLYWKKYINFLDLSLELNDEVLFYQWITSNCISYWGKGREIFDFIFRKVQIQIIPYQTVNPIDSVQVSKRVYSHFPKDTWWDKYLVRYFIKTIDLCKNHNIQVVLVRYPVSKPYYDMVNKKVNPAVFYDKVNKLLSEKELNIPLIDFHDIFFSDSDRNFYDPDHLNYQSSYNFSIALKNTLKTNKSRMNQ